MTTEPKVSKIIIATEAEGLLIERLLMDSCSNSNKVVREIYSYFVKSAKFCSVQVV